ncbi:MAG TPA: beta-eliminating lyase-related protein, partial [Minicystis sp.]|nr:beta-eliminating lyase-related protein [Minicystis sp.]
THHSPPRGAPLRQLAALAASTPADLEQDHYGEAPWLAAFEAEVAALVGHEAAVFMPSGTMAQQIALRIWAGRRGTRHVAFHPLCHLEEHEAKGYEVLHGLYATHLGARNRMLTADDVRGVKEPLAAVLLELPQREIGGALPSWGELEAQIAAAKALGARVHLDGARLWECGPHYGTSYSEIGRRFDSVYVSFYKGLGAIAGCALAGPADFVAEARVWQKRHGGALVALYPYVLSARAALALRLPKMRDYVDRARRLAAVFAALPGVDVAPSPPPTNMFHAWLPGTAEALERAAVDVSEASGVWLFGKVSPSPVTNKQVVEVTVGDAALELDDARIEALLRDVLRRAAASS